MKTLGLVGGIGPESTIASYRAIIAAGRAVAPESGQPPVLINSIDAYRLFRLVGEGALIELADYLAGEVERLALGTADIASIASNTPHIVFDDVRERSRHPRWCSIVEATRDAVRAMGLGRVALFWVPALRCRHASHPDVFSTTGARDRIAYRGGAGVHPRQRT